MEMFYKHIFDQLGLSGCTYHLTETEIVIVDIKGEEQYRELLFHGVCTFTENELEHLIALSERTSYELPSNFPIAKSWFLIVHEFYFKDNIQLDRYGRQHSENLTEEFKRILTVPIADILKFELLRKIGLPQSSNKRVIYSSDYDHLNIWDEWTFRNYLGRSFRAIKAKHFKTFFQLSLSFLFSRKIERFNYYLNGDMFRFEKQRIGDWTVENKAFFITSKNEGYDGKNRYNSKVVKRFINFLRENNVEIGLHTSFYTYDNPILMNEQIEYFNLIFESYPLSNRHHYLRFQNPEFLNVLEENGIVEDHSLYFAESMLFRCGTCSSFVPWNSKLDRPYRLKLTPITLMEGTFKDYLKVDFNEAKNLALRKLTMAVQFSTDISLLWHNSSMYKQGYIENNYYPDLLEYINLELEHLLLNSFDRQYKISNY